QLQLKTTCRESTATEDYLPGGRSTATEDYLPGAVGGPASGCGRMLFGLRREHMSDFASDVIL
ncbi:MAG TPA: hypothetical protein VHE82_10490, partial [Gemmatimonadaceae bacterium]|nr:hypothetical protein [Gemmatimonadaceae bacterium]